MDEEEEMQKTRSSAIILIISILVIFLNSCTSIECRKELFCISLDSFTSITIQDSIKSKMYNLEINKKIKLDVSEFSNGIIEISTPTLFHAYQFGEYDHWFPITHKIELRIYKDHIDYKSGGLQMTLIADNRKKYREIIK